MTKRKKTKKIRSLQNKPYSESLSYIGRLIRRSGRTKGSKVRFDSDCYEALSEM